MNTKTVSILGAGWLGLPLAQRLIERGYRVKGSTTRPEIIDQIREGNIEPFLFSFEPDLYFTDLGHTISEFFDSDILFLNIPFRRDFNDPQQYCRQLSAIIPFIEQSSLHNLIFASSTSIYPENAGLVDETSGIDIKNLRAKALFEAEQMIANCKGKTSTVIRFGGLFGGSRRIGQFLAGKKDIPNPEKPVNLIHREDCINIVMRLIDEDVNHEIFNAVSDEHPTRRELYVCAAKSMGIEPPKFIENINADYKIVSNNKIKEHLNYKFIWPDPLKAVSC